MESSWKTLRRPGYFGRNRDKIIAGLDKKYGTNGWRLVWIAEGQAPLEFLQACRVYYEESYFRYLRNRKEDLDFICSFGEVIDNAPTNVESGRDYSLQESHSTHIQDIAIRNVLWRLNRRFGGQRDNILTVRSQDSNGRRFSPGYVPFYDHMLIEAPFITPQWANANSVESFWQSNKKLQVREVQTRAV